MSAKDDLLSPPLPLETQKLLPTHFRRSFIIFVLASVGPIGLPLVWFHPTLSFLWKMAITAITLLATWAIIVLIISMSRHLIDQYNTLRSLMF